MKYLIIPTILFTLIGTAEAKNHSCNEVKDCIELVSVLTGDKYLIDKSVKGKISFSKNYKITKENANEFISYALHSTGYTRISVKNGLWSVINARDIRYSAPPHFDVGKESIPDTYDYLSATLKLKNPHLAPEVSRNFRPFMSRYGRIIDIKTPGIIIINDTGKNINRLIKYVKQLDKEPTKEEQARFQQKRKHREKVELLKAKNCGDSEKKLTEVTSLIRSMTRDRN